MARLGPGRARRSRRARLLPRPALTGLPGAFGPTLAALFVTTFARGTGGLRRLLGRLLVWRIGVRWYTFVLFWPVVLSLATTALYVASGGTAPDFARPPFADHYPLPPEMQEIGPWPLLPFVFLQQMLLGSAMGEEIGWRGFALPLLGLTLKWAAVLAIIHRAGAARLVLRPAH